MQETIHPFIEGIYDMHTQITTRTAKETPYKCPTQEGQDYNMGAILAADALNGFNSFAGNKAPDGIGAEELTLFVMKKLQLHQKR